MWRAVSRSCSRPLPGLQGVSFRVLVVRTWKAVIADRLFGHAAELGFYFLFALFPTLFCAGAILGLAARSADEIYNKLLGYLAVLIPTSALETVLETFNETTAAATRGKLTFGTIAAIWSASVGISAIQDTLNAVHKLKDNKSYFVARMQAIAITIVLMVIATLTLASLFAGDFVAAMAFKRLGDNSSAMVVAWSARVIGWSLATALLILAIAVLYYWAPAWECRHWRWLTPGGAIGVLGWLLASLGLRLYLHFFNNYSVTYGSLGAVIILLTWFYITGLMLLLGAEIDSVIDATAAEMRSARAGPVSRVANAQENL